MGRRGRRGDLFAPVSTIISARRNLFPESALRASQILVALLVPVAIQAQEGPPSSLAEVESARSRACVGSIARFDELNATLEPYGIRMERLRALGRAVSLEDIAEAAPLSEADSVEAAVARWFASDSALAVRFVVLGDSTIQEERSRGRTAILDLIRQSMQAVGTEAQSHLGDAAAIEAAVQPCQGAILVRGAVLEACAGSTSDLCRAAAVPEATEPYRFVDRPEDLWDIEDYRPWTTPEPLQGTADGALTGARSAALARIGNVVISLGLAPLLRNRAELDSASVAEFEANLDSLGFTFEHPLFVMTPAIEIFANLPAPLGGETHFIVHFGDLSGDDVIWSAEAGKEGVLQATFPASARDLARLQAGDAVSLTAVRVPEGENPEAVPVYTLSLLQVGQALNVGALVQYMAGGGLARDLAAIVPPEPGAGSPRR